MLSSTSDTTTFLIESAHHCTADLSNELEDANALTAYIKTYCGSVMCISISLGDLVY